MNTELQNGVTQKNEVGKLSTVYGNINSSQRSTATLTPPDKYVKIRGIRAEQEILRRLSPSRKALMLFRLSPMDHKESRFYIESLIFVCVQIDSIV